MKGLMIVAVISTTLALSGCITPDDPNRNTKIGAGIGVLAGAVIGKQVGGDKGRTAGAVLGGGVGALIGYDRDKQQQRLEASLEAERRANQVSVTRIDNETIKLGLDSSVTFNVDSYTISYAFQNTLDKIAGSLLEFPDTRVDIIGHTDNTGSDSYNQQLSERRAGAVGQYFGQRGVTYSRLKTSGRGESQPVANNATPYGRAQNRRVEIFLRSQ